MLSQLSTEITEMGNREEELDFRIARARKTMMARADKDLHPHQPSVTNSLSNTLAFKPQNGDGTIVTTDLSKPADVPTGTPEKETGFTHSNISSPLPTPKPDTSETPSISGQQTPKRKQKKVATSKLFSIVIFDEFLKELAAISQEQSIVSPVMYGPCEDDEDDIDDVR